MQKSTFFKKNLFFCLFLFLPLLNLQAYCQEVYSEAWTYQIGELALKGDKGSMGFIYSPEIKAIVGTGPNGSVYCLDLEGKELWKTKVQISSDNITYDPATERLFITPSNKYCYCFHPNGQFLWERYGYVDLEPEPKYDPKNYSSLLHHSKLEKKIYDSKGKRFFCQFPYKILCLGLERKTVWEYRLNKENWNKDWLNSEPYFQDIEYDPKTNKLFCAANANEVHCINASNGKVIWESTFFHDEYVPDSRELIYRSNKLFCLDSSFVFYCIDPSTGKMLWCHTLRGNFESEGTAFDTPNNRLFYGGFDLHCINISTGEIISKKETENIRKVQYDPENRRLFYLTEEAKLHCIDTSIYGTDQGEISRVNTKGDLLWKYKTLGELNQIVLDPTNNNLICSSKSGSLCSLTQDGKLNWEYRSLKKPFKTQIDLENQQTLFFFSEESPPLIIPHKQLDHEAQLDRLWKAIVERVMSEPSDEDEDGFRIYPSEPLMEVLEAALEVTLPSPFDGFPPIEIFSCGEPSLTEKAFSNDLIDEVLYSYCCLEDFHSRIQEVKNDLVNQYLNRIVINKIINTIFSDICHGLFDLVATPSRAVASVLNFFEIEHENTISEAHDKIDEHFGTNLAENYSDELERMDLLLIVPGGKKVGKVASLVEKSLLKQVSKGAIKELAEKASKRITKDAAKKITKDAAKVASKQELASELSKVAEKAAKDISKDVAKATSKREVTGELSKLVEKAETKAAKVSSKEIESDLGKNISSEKIAGEITKPSSTKGWKVGEPINNLTAEGDVPKWGTVRQRYWKNKALEHRNGTVSGELKYIPTEENLKRMEKGLAPQVWDEKTKSMKSIELHHNPPQREGGLFDVTEVTPTEHAKIDSNRQLGKGQGSD